jgi:hypothetical protein
MCRLKLTILIVFLYSSVFSQIPEKALFIADSVCLSRWICPNMNVQLVDSTFYPKEKTVYQDRKHEIYSFKYLVQLREDLTCGFGFSVNEDLSLEAVKGFPDKAYRFSPCDIMTRHELWRIAKKNGLRSGFRKCEYILQFGEDSIDILFLEEKPGWYQDTFAINAISGEFLKHRRAVVSN